jgi:uncharacterized protein
LFRHLDICRGLPPSHPDSARCALLWSQPPRKYCGSVCHSLDYLTANSPVLDRQKNNGVLLLVAPTEHKVRIEVGYGLEGTLTNALSSVIISSVIVPRFKTGDYSGGIERGVDAIISVLQGDSADWHPKVNVRKEDASSDFDKLYPILFFAIMIFIVWYLSRQAGGPPSGGAGRRGGPIFIPYGGSGWGSGWGGGGGGFGGGFSGGGGSSGGGGASGGW